MSDKSEKQTSFTKRVAVTPPRTILFTDIVGSSRFFSSRGDTAGLRMLGRHNRSLFPIVEAARGRVVKTLGDGILAVFEHPTDALIAAFAMQKRLKDERASAPEGEDFSIRIGVHYGLVTEKGGDVFGDAVNMAERVKSHADGDRIFVSRTVRDLLRTDPDFAFHSMGVRELKGGAESVELFELASAPDLPAIPWWLLWSRRAARPVRRHPAIALALLVLALAAGLWWGVIFPSAPPSDAIVVMPFRNLTNDPETDYLSLALAAELHAQLQAIETVTVRPLSSVKSYKGKSWEPAELARALQVGIIIDGSFVRSGDQLRVTVEIVDFRGRRTLPVKPFQGQIAETLNLIDQVARDVVGAMRLQVADNAQIFRFGTQSMPAYDAYLRGVALQEEVTRENNLAAIDVLRDAVTRDPKFARAHAALALAYATHFWWNFSNDPAWLDSSEGSARQALSLDSQLVEAHHALAYALEGKGRRAEAIREYMVCFRLNPRYVPALVYLARYSFYMGEFDLALGVLERIARIDPVQNVHMRRAINLFFWGKREEAVAANRRAESRAQGVDELTFIGISYIWLNELESAERVMEKLQKQDPQALSLSEIRAWLYTARGRIPEARQEMDRFAARPSWGIKQGLAALYALQGDRGQALDWLERAIASGGPSYAWFKSDHFALLRGDSRYEAALKKLADEYEPLRAEFRKLLSATLS